MNVLIINGQASLYGAEQTLRELVRTLDGVRVTVLTRRAGPLVEKLSLDGIHTIIHDFGKDTGDDEESQYAFAGRILDQRQIDLVHMNKPHLANLGFVRALRAATRERRIPLIAHIRSNEFCYVEDQLSLLAEMDVLIFVSNGLRREFCDQCELTGKGDMQPVLETVYNGRSLADYEFSTHARDRLRRQIGLGDEDYVIGMLGYLSPVKGQDRLVQLARRFHGNDAMKFVIVGGPLPEDPEYSRGVAKLISRYGLEKQVYLTGYLDAREVYSGLDVVVSMSLGEGLPGVLIEAMAARRCVVAWSVGGVSEVIGSDGAGVVIEPVDFVRTAEAIEQLYVDVNWRESMTRIAHQRVHRQFDAARMGEETGRLYARATGRLHRLDTSELATSTGKTNE